MIHNLSMTLAPKPAVNYPLWLGAKISDLPGLFPLQAFSKIVIITDHHVKKLYGLSLHQQLTAAGHGCLLLSFQAGEHYKNNATKQEMENAMLLQRCDRNTLIIALGGGVVGDMAGFIAATFLRGVSYLQLPTTLLAMVDSSIGGKTALNTQHGKNLIGAIYQPQGVLADVKTLKTLSRKALINGLIEAIKMFLTHDAASFDYTLAHLSDLLQGEEAALTEIILRAINIKKVVVERDETEKAERALLNFGHTIGHALEKLADYQLLHGYAVAYGILVEATISHLLGILDAQSLTIIKNLFAALGIHGSDLKDFSSSSILAATRSDKKVCFDKVHYTLLQSIGQAYIREENYTHPVTDDIVIQAFQLTIAEVAHVG